jgi:hypothetical protein
LSTLACTGVLNAHTATTSSCRACMTLNTIHHV